MNPISKSDVRNVLAQYFVSLATSPSYWFTLNSSSDDEYHLFHRLGLTNYDDYKNLLVAAGLARFTGGQFCIQRYQWENFCGHEYFITDTNTDEVLECTRKSKRNCMPPSKFIFEIERKNMRNNGERQSFYTLRIGKMAISSSLDFESQKIKRESPPRMSKILRVQQQAFLSSAANIIADTEIYLGSILCDEVEPMMTAEEEDSTTPTTSIISPNTTMMATTTTTTTTMTTAAVSHGSNDTSAATQYLTPYRLADAAYHSTITPASAEETITPSTIGQQYPALARVFGNNFDPFQDDIHKTIHMFLTEITHILDSSKSGLKVKDFGGHDINYIRVPQAGSDKTFNNSKSWVDEALKINGMSHNGTNDSAF